VPSVSCITTGDDNAGADHDNPAAAVGELCCVELLAAAVGLGVVLGCCFDDVVPVEGEALDAADVEGVALVVGFDFLAGFSCFFQ
jgi:hypothetical protein